MCEGVWTYTLRPARRGGTVYSSVMGAENPVILPVRHGYDKAGPKSGSRSPVCLGCGYRFQHRPPSLRYTRRGPSTGRLGAAFLFWVFSTGDDV